MQVAIMVVGTVGIVALILVCVICFGLVCARAFERASEGVMQAARMEERARIAQHYATTSWWFSEFPDVQHALALVTEELVTGRQNSSQLRDDWKRKTGRKP